MSPKNLTILLASAAILALNTACAEGTDSPAPVAATEATESTEASPATETHSDRWSEGMRNIPVDGSSLEAFNESLEKIKQDSKESEYTTLTNAIDYLLIYDLAAKRDRARLAANLDGMTGAQIVDRVYWRKGNKYRGKPAE